MKVGDIVRIFAPTAGKKKYHFCVCIPENEIAGCFLFLNSDPNFRDCLSFDCERIPFLPVSQTGKTAISFSIMLRHSDEKLKLFGAEVLGEMPKDLIAEMIGFLDTVTSMPSKEKAIVRASLNILK